MRDEEARDLLWELYSENETRSYEAAAQLCARIAQNHAELAVPLARKMVSLLAQNDSLLPDPPANTGKIAYTFEQAGEAVSLSKFTIQRLVKGRQIPAVKCG